MRNIFLAALFFTAQVFAADTVLNTNKVKIGQKSSAAVKVLEFDTNQGALNPKVQVSPSTNKLQFTNDGTVFKDIGSGSGGGSGINLLSNGGFETGLSDGWISSGGTFALVTSGTNLLYELNSASFTASAGAQYFESTAITVPNILQGADCLLKFQYKGGDANAYMTLMDGASAEIIPTSARFILNSVAGVKTGKIYFTCPSSGSVKLRNVSTAASVLASFDQIFLGETDARGVSSITSWKPDVIGNTPWTNTTYTVRSKRIGDTLKINVGMVLTGTPVGTNLDIVLPAGLQIDTSKRVGVGSTTSNVVGSGKSFNNASSVTNLLVVYNSTTSVRIGYESTAAGVVAPVTITAPYTYATNMTLDFEFEVPILGWNGSEDGINSKCQNDVECENSFSAFISSAGTVSSENLDWINGNCSGGASQTCTLAIAGLSNPLLCIGNSTENGVATSARVFTLNRTLTTTTQIAWTTHQSGSGNVTSDVNITCIKQQSDFKTKQTIQGFLSSTVTSGINNLRILKFKLAGGTDSTVCSASPCTSYRSTDPVTITRIAVGQYNNSWASGIFSEIPSCSFGVSVGAGSGFAGYNGTASVSTIGVNIVSHATGGVNTDAVIDVTCVGVR